jgi:predicted transcriptional regulator
MKELGKLILVQMYDRLKNENIQSSRVSQYDLLYQIQNVYGNLTNFTRAVSEENFNMAMNELLHQHAVRQRTQGGWTYYQLTEKGREQAGSLMTQLQHHKYLQREPASHPLAGYRTIEPDSYKGILVFLGLVAVVALLLWRWLGK